MSTGMLNIIVSADQSNSEVVLTSNNASYASLPNSVDLSTSPCFPPIENQGKIGSCASYATAYYQYSYEVNKLNNVSSTSERKLYSPNWAYSLANNGMNEGSNIVDNYRVLQALGCVTTDVLPISENYQVWPRYNEEAKVEALKTRLENYDYLDIPSKQNISSPSNLISNNFTLSAVKQMLNEGKVLAVSTKGFFNSASVNGDCVAYRCYEGAKDKRHALAIVGYNNYISYDVNGNGTIESCERGAFKVANSWGEKFNQNGIFSDDGYFWIMYDALNLSSTNTYTDWESNLESTRYPAFSYSLDPNDGNTFYYINVEHKNVELIGEVKVRTMKKYRLDLYSCRTTQDRTLFDYPNQLQLFPYIGGTDRPSFYEGLILCDLTELTVGIPTYYQGYNWHMKLSNFIPSEESNYARFRLLDGNGNVISDYEADDSEQAMSARKYKTLNLNKGDLNYDGSVTVKDADIIMDYLAENVSLSSLQYKLADVNNDGTVNIFDVIEINSSIPAPTNADDTYALNRLNKKIQQYCNENNINL